MHTVVNHLTLHESVDWPDVESKVEEFQASLSAERSEFRGVSLVRVSGTHAILLVFFTTLEALQEISRDIAAPWFTEHLKPYLAGPVDRHVGEIVAGFLK